MSELALHFDTIIVIGMGLSFILNLFFFVSGINRQVSLLFVSGVMASSYFISNHLLNLNYDNWVFVEWTLYDLITMLIIFIFHKVKKIKFSIAAYYICIGLLINSSLFSLMFIDINILEAKDAWWFWYAYTIVVNVVDVLMVSALIINRDFLGLMRLTPKFLR